MGLLIHFLIAQLKISEMPHETLRVLNCVDFNQQEVGFCVGDLLLCLLVATGWEWV